MIGARMTGLRRRVLAGRRCALFVRCLMTLYVVSLATPLPLATSVERSQVGGFVLELCTGDGAQSAMIGATTRPPGDGHGGHRSDHDCPACGLGCVSKSPCGGGLVVAVAMPDVAQVSMAPAPSSFQLATARAPLPPRGPPTLS